MIKIIRRLLHLSGNFSAKIRIAFVFGFLEGIFYNLPILALLYILHRHLSEGLKTQDIRISGVLILAGLIGQYGFRRLVYIYQDATGYEVFERERIKIGDLIKRFPMGYFTEGNLGNLTAVVTSDITFVETWAMTSIYKIINGYASMIIGSVFLLIFDLRVGLVTIATYAVALLVFNRLQRIGREQSVIKQQTQAELSDAVLEFVQGITVIKAFNLGAEKTKTTKASFKSTRDHSIEFEEKFIPPTLLYDICFNVGIGLTIFFVALLYNGGELDMSIMLMILVFVFQLYLPTKALGILTMKMRVMEASLDRYEAVKQVETIDESGQETSLDRFDIDFRGVSFAYDEKEVLDNISFRIPENGMTALIGASGSGKTTIANLIARFWDVEKGEIRIGGHNIKEISHPCFMKNISMVFQNVYLFHDTILNNIKFGNPEASEKEILDAARKARCHDFIERLEHGWDTVVGEGGSTLSGGEKQRISIARAILKDAPIILLDEATASIDPDNEKHIQNAINELVRNKTLIVIAHRLSTIRHADQILVIDDGQLAQSGKHDELIEEEGLYRHFWNKRTNVRSWRIQLNPSQANPL